MSARSPPIPSWEHKDEDETGTLQEKNFIRYLEQRLPDTDQRCSKSKT